MLLDLSFVNPAATFHVDKGGVSVCSTLRVGGASEVVYRE